MCAVEAAALRGDTEVPSLLRFCVQKLAQTLVKYGAKKVRLAKLAALPQRALDALLEHLVAKNALNDNFLPHLLTRHTRALGLEGSAQLRRCVLNTIGWSCPNMRILDVSMCKQIDNRIVRDVLQYCERLEILRLDGCTRISDSAFAPSLWKPPLAGLLGLRELAVGKCAQITSEGLMGYVIKGAPLLTSLALEYCRLAITDEVACELLFCFGLEKLDLAFCTQLTDDAFRAPAARASHLRDLRLAGNPLGDPAVAVLAKCAPQLESLDLGWVSKLTDHSVAALVEFCGRLRVLNVCNTQITDASFKALAGCHCLEHLDASWCLRATPRGLGHLAGASPAPPLRCLVLDHVGALNLNGESVGPLMPLASPGLWDKPQYGRLKGSPPPLLRFPPEPPSLSLPPPAIAVAMDEELAPTVLEQSRAPPEERPLVLARCLLESFVAVYAAIECLFLDGVGDVATVPALQAVAASCPRLLQLALLLSPREPRAGASEEDAVRDAVRAVGTKCQRLTLLRLDSSLRPHRPVVAALALPSFARLRSLSLVCSVKAGGLLDHELETVLTGRSTLETLALRNCEGISEDLFPRWCNRPSERREVAEEQLDEALRASMAFGLGAAPGLLQAPAVQATVPAVRAPRRHGGRRHLPRSPTATAMRSVTSFSLCGATAQTDRSADSLAELLHEAQTVEIRGSPLLAEESVRSFRKGCRFIRSVVIVTRDRTLSWHASTSSVKKHHPQRKSKLGTSGSSGTESG